MCGVVPHSITDIVDGLERDGLAERQPDPADRRAKLIRLTDKGAAALTAATATREHLLNTLFGALDAAEQQNLLDLLDRLDTALTSLSAGDAPAPVRRRGRDGRPGSTSFGRNPFACHRLTSSGRRPPATTAG